MTRKRRNRRREGYRKPSRPCPYCTEMQSVLSRHLKRRHCDQVGVQNALALKGKACNLALSLLKKEGIFQKNQVLFKEKRKNEIIREKFHGTYTEKVATCAYCKGTLSSSISKHLQNCPAVGETTEYVVPISKANLESYVMNRSFGKEFASQILSNFRNPQI